MCRSSAMTVGIQGSRASGLSDCLTSSVCSWVSSATAITLLRLPEENKSADTDEQAPAECQRPDVRRKIRGGVSVDEREAHEVHVDGRGVDLDQVDQPWG